MSRWIIFLSIILSIYGALHLYLLIKVRRAFYLESWSYFLIVVILLYLMMAPVQARILESQNYPIASIIVTWIGYLWMGCLFVWLWLSLILDVYHLGVMFLQRLFCADWIHLMLSRRQSFSLTIMITVGLMIFGAYAAQKINIKYISLNSEKIPTSTERVRLVQISDIHLGQMIFPGRLNRIISAVNSTDPDILVSTGDLIDSHIYGQNAVVQKCQTMNAKMGKFAVTGNHEAYEGIQHSSEFTKAAGFTLLRNTSVIVADCIAIAGVDDPAISEPIRVHEADLLATLPDDHYKVLLKHQPVVNSTSRGRFDLQLSGHAHAGQIFPFSILVKLAYPLFKGMYPISPGGRVYVSPGTGTWGPPIRIGAPPEVTVIDLLPSR